MQGKIQPIYFQEWPRTWIEVGSKLGIIDWKHSSHGS